MPTIKDVAKLAGVSVSTVSRALSNKVFVEDETKAKVLCAVKELNYRPNFLAKGLKDGCTNTFGLLLPDLENLFYPKIMKSIEKYAAEQGYNIIICNTNESKAQEIKDLEMLKNRYVDGIIVITVSDDIEHILRLQQDNIPFVFVNRYFAKDVNCITSDNRYGAYSMIKYLIENGHEKISCVLRSFSLQIYKERYEGCVTAFRECGIKDYEQYFMYDVNSITDAYNRTKEILNKSERPTAFFASTDMLSIGIYSGITDCGLKIPDDISVVGYDNIHISKHTMPPLTTFEAPVDEIGKATIQNLLKQIELKKQTKAQKKILKGSIIIRNSVKKLNQ